MNGKSEQAAFSHSVWQLLFALAEYRSPMSISEYICYKNIHGSSVYYLCPRCKTALEREFQTCCDRCGQCLNWKYYRKAKRRALQRG